MRVRLSAGSTALRSTIQIPVAALTQTAVVVSMHTAGTQRTRSVSSTAAWSPTVRDYTAMGVIIRVCAIWDSSGSRTTHVLCETVLSTPIPVLATATAHAGVHIVGTKPARPAFSTALSSRTLLNRYLQRSAIALDLFRGIVRLSSVF